MTGDALVGPGRNNDPDSLRQLVQEMQDLRRYVDDRTAQILRTAGLRAEPDLLRVQGSLVVEGDLSVPNGSIDNAALAHPVEYRSARASEYNFAITTAQAERGYSSLVAPAGYTQAMVTTFASLLAKNSTATTQYVYLRAQVRDETSGAYQYSLRQQITLAAGFWGTLIVPMIFALDLNPGDTIRGMGLVSSSATLAADVDVVCDSELSASFSR